jgi:hypothetical protein
MSLKGAFLHSSHSSSNETISAKKISREYKYFIDGNFTRYSGSWVAIKENRVVSQDKDIGKLMNIVKKKGIVNVVYTKIPSKNTKLLLL